MMKLEFLEISQSDDIVRVDIDHGYCAVTVSSYLRTVEKPLDKFGLRSLMTVT